MNSRQEGSGATTTASAVGRPQSRGRHARRLDAAHTAGLQEGLRMYRSMFERGSLGQLIVDFSDFHIRVVNQALCLMTGYSVDELVGAPVAKIFPADRNPTLDAVARLAQGSVDGYSAERALQHKNGTIFPILSTVSAVRDESGNTIQALVLMQDLTQQHEVKQAGLRSHALIDAAVMTLPVVFTTFDTTGRATFVAGGRELEGISVDDYIGKRISEITPDARASLAIDGALMGTESTSRVVVEGNTYLTLYAPMRDDLGAIVGAISVSTDITAEVSAEAERWQAEESTLFAVRHDALTGLLGRSGLLEHLTDLVSTGHSSGALILLDLDDFNLINDSLGHDVGDAVLLEVAARMSKAFPGLVIAKPGGDEFAVVAPSILDRAQAAVAARRISAMFEADVEVHGHALRVTASLGIAVHKGRRGVSALTLIRNAASALSHAKGAGSGQYRLYDAVMRRRVRQQLEIQDGLRRAMRGDELHLVYQPIVNLRDRRITGAEALLRWTHPTHGPIPPIDFIPLAEKSGLIVPIGQWVMDTASSNIVTLQRTFGTYIAVNVSVRQLIGGGFAEWVEDVLTRTGLRPGSLTIEVTESALMGDIGPIRSAFHRLRSQGVKVSIDDFGTGYSSLARLQRLPVDVIKLDRAFVTNVDTRREAQAMAGAILQVSAAIGASIVAEGVETESEAAALLDLGYTAGQGYLFGRPMHIAELSERLVADERSRTRELPTVA
jgi:diguanylate cyclase (GGDEF)-like protein/PAS domain S-box-containing protein